MYQLMNELLPEEWLPNNKTVVLARGVRIGGVGRPLLIATRPATGAAQKITH